MKMKKFILLMALPLLLLGVGAFAWNWLLHSESGARWLFAKLEASKVFSLSASALSGDLGSGLHLEGIVFENKSLRLDVNRLSAALDIDLFPVAVNLDMLQADTIVIRTLSAPDSDQTVSLEDSLRGISLPLPVRIRKVSLDHLEYFDISGNSQVTVQSVRVSGGLYDTLELTELNVSIANHELNLTAQLGLLPPFPLAADFKSEGEYSATGHLEGSLENLQVEVASEAPRARLTGTLHQLLNSPGWNLQLQSPDLRWPLDSPEPDVRIENFSALSSGALGDYTLELDGNLEAKELEASALVLKGSGDTEGFSFRQFELQGTELSLESSGKVAWQETLSLELNAVLNKLSPDKWVSGWPQGHPVMGDIDLSWSGDQVTISEFNLAVSGTSFSASGDALYDLPSNVVSGKLSWAELSWPPGDQAPELTSRQGQFEVSGSPDQWRLEGELDIQAAELPPGQLKLSGSGNLESLEIQVHEGAILGGNLYGNAAYGWTGNQPFRISVNASQIQTGPLFEQYPGILDVELTASGQVEPLRIEADIQQLSGSIRQIPFSADGAVQWDQGRLLARNLAVHSNTSSLMLNGSLFEPDGIEFAVEIASLSDFSMDLGGALTARGALSLHPDSPFMSAVLTAQQIQLGQTNIDSIETRQNELVVSGLTLGERTLESLTLRFNSGRPLEKLAITAVLESNTINAEFDGTVIDWNDPLGSGWKGQLSSFDLHLLDQFNLWLEEPAAIDLGLDRFSLQSTCLTGEYDARLCLDAAWKSQGNLSFSTNINDLPVNLVELFVDTDARFTQRLNGNLNWSRSQQGIRTGNARIELSPGAISLEGEDEILLENGPGLLAFEVTDGRLQGGTLDMAFPGSGNIDVDFDVADLFLGLDSAVQGRARIKLQDIGTLTMMLPVLDTVDGALDIDLELGGTVSDPSFNGHVNINDGKIEDLASGLSFSQISLTGEITEQDRSVLKGKFRAGEGTGEINATIVFVDLLAPEIDLSLQGEQLTLIDVPDLTVIANPDLQLGWRDHTLQINGRLKIPSTRLSPSFIPASTVRQSADIVIVAGELPGKKQGAQEEKAISIKGNLEVELGDDFLIDLDVAKINVTGKALFTWNDDLIPMGNGSFNATGDIQAFGQFLQVTRGRISFPDSPADNPHLNIRAEREIFGNSQIRTAGLMVAGTLNRPVVEAYTVPLTNKQRAQTLLVTGSDFNYEQGVGAVDVGMYVLPRLYVSYGIGVFEDGNVLKVRYDLTRGFGIRATSGQRESGLDLSYTIER
jgi:translocation and assembly module TamB